MSQHERDVGTNRLLQSVIGRHDRSFRIDLLQPHAKRLAQHTDMRATRLKNTVEQLRSALQFNECILHAIEDARERSLLLQQDIQNMISDVHSTTLAKFNDRLMEISNQHALFDHLNRSRTFRGWCIGHDPAAQTNGEGDARKPDDTRCAYKEWFDYNSLIDDTWAHHRQLMIHNPILSTENVCATLLRKLDPACLDSTHGAWMSPTSIVWLGRPLLSFVVGGGGGGGESVEDQCMLRFPVSNVVKRKSREGACPTFNVIWLPACTIAVTCRVPGRICDGVAYVNWSDTDIADHAQRTYIIRYLHGRDRGGRRREGERRHVGLYMRPTDHLSFLIGSTIAVNWEATTRTTCPNKRGHAHKHAVELPVEDVSANCTIRVGIPRRDPKVGTLVTLRLHECIVNFEALVWSDIRDHLMHHYRAAIDRFQLLLLQNEEQKRAIRSSINSMGKHMNSAFDMVDWISHSAAAGSVGSSKKTRQ